MRAKFIALSFCCVSIAHCGLVKDLVGGGNVECITSKEPSRPSDLAIPEAKSAIHRDPNQFQTQVVYSNPITSLDVERARRENQNQLLGLYQDSQELSAMKLQIKRECFELRLLLKYYPNDHFRVFYNAFNVLTQMHEALIVIFKQLKLSDLLRIDLVESNSNLINLIIPRKRGQSQDFSTLPAEIIQLITQKSWINVGNSMTAKLKSLSRDLIFESTYRFEMITFQLWWECGLRTMDFLFKYKFADKSIIGSFFQDNYIIEQVIHYIALRYEEDLGVSLLRRTPYLTEHWYWSLLHESFQAVTKKQEIIFNGHVLLITRHMVAREQCREYDSDIPSPKFTAFFESFDSERYLKRLLALDRTHQSHSHDDAMEIDSPTKIKLDVERLMNLIAISTTQLRLLPLPAQKIIMLHISELLDFITRFIYPGIIEKIPMNKVDFDEFDAKFNAMLIFSKINNIDASAHDYFEYIQKQSPSDWFTSKVYKSKFDAYLNQAIHLHHEHQVESLRLKNKIGNAYLQSSSENAMNRLGIILQGSLNDLKKKIEKFS